jgi:hypothetical protein
VQWLVEQTDCYGMKLPTGGFKLIGHDADLNQYKAVISQRQAHKSTPQVHDAMF